MKIVLIAVVSLNGKITWGSVGPQVWASAEDQQFFSDRVQKSRLIVMGSGTYEQSRAAIKLRASTLRVVLTNRPEKYQAEYVVGQLEFSAESPLHLVQRLEKLGYTELLLVGGGKVNAAFLQANLVSEIFLTVEPVIFAQGINLFDSDQKMRKLQLVSTKKLNDAGTLLLHYAVQAVNLR